MSTLIANTAIIIGGLLSFALAIYHCTFYHIFKWNDEFQKISVLNARIFMTLHIGLIAVFMFFSFLSFVYTKELGQCNGLAGVIIGFYAFVWLFRTIWQVTYLRVLHSEKPFSHYVFTVWFFLLFVAYSIPVVVNLSR
ncbi:MAG: hypothetical protein AB1649_21415 [Chloroflexota bacterium]